MKNYRMLFQRPVIDTIVLAPTHPHFRGVVPGKSLSQFVGEYKQGMRILWGKAT